MKNQIKTHEDIDRQIAKLLKLVKEDPEAAKIAVKVALIRTGVMDEDGSMKKQIVDNPHSLIYEFKNKPKRRIRKKQI